ncbi:hypothetical protein GCM10011384_24370 [Psychrobacillus lasiicapitis]|nr:hypothetical protein GCM10011384_24370 [Psychrobacillus lasiicapitis]
MSSNWSGDTLFNAMVNIPTLISKVIPAEKSIRILEVSFKNQGEIYHIKRLNTV